MREKKVYVAAAAFLTITTMVGTVMAGCGSGGSHIAGTSGGAVTRQLTWGDDGPDKPVAVTATPAPQTRQLTWGDDGPDKPKPVTATPAPAPTDAP